MGSCLTSESRSPRPGMRSSAAISDRSRKNTMRRPGSRTSLFDYRREEPLYRIPGRLFLNGSSNIASLFSQQGKKGTNQDAMIVWENFGSRTDTLFCGVFDGHGPYGHMVAKRVRDSLPLKLNAQWEVNDTSVDVLRGISINSVPSMNVDCATFLSPDEEYIASIDVAENEDDVELFQTLRESFLRAFKVMDRELKMHPNIDCFCSGTTAVALIKQGPYLVMGNVGDSRAVLAARDDDDCLVPIQLTLDLKPNLPEEEERIRRCNGRVFALPDEPEVTRVWLPNSDSPGLAMARALGDFCLKDFGLISVPDITCRRLGEKDEFVVLATDGVWDVLSNSEVVETVGSAPTRSSAAKTLVESAVRAWKSKFPSSKMDDCAVVCLFLDSNSCSRASSPKSDDQPAGAGSCVGAGASPMDFDTDRRKCSDNGSDSHVIRYDKDETPTSAIEWSALEGVSRVNTLLGLPRFVPPNLEEEEEEEEEVSGAMEIEN